MIKSWRRKCLPDCLRYCWSGGPIFGWPSSNLLVAANARVGVAKSLFFPSISLTGSGGYQNFQISSLFKSEGGVYGYGGSLVQPILTPAPVGQLQGLQSSAGSRDSELSEECSGVHFGTWPIR